METFIIYFYNFKHQCQTAVDLCVCKLIIINLLLLLFCFKSFCLIKFKNNCSLCIFNDSLTQCYTIKCRSLPDVITETTIIIFMYFNYFLCFKAFIIIILLVHMTLCSRYSISRKSHLYKYNTFAVCMFIYFLFLFQCRQCGHYPVCKRISLSI